MDGDIAKRQRGRPKGTGRHQKAKLDEMWLDKLADSKMINPSAKTAVIIKQLIDTQTDTGGLRRLQRAFKQNELHLIGAARERAQAQQNAAMIQQIKTGLEVFLTIREGIKAFDRSPKGQEFRATVDSFSGNVAELMNSPQLQPWLALSRSQLGQHQPDNQNPWLQIK